MFDKLNALQAQMEEVKNRLASIQVEGLAEGGKVIATVDGNKQLIAINISEEIIGDKDQMEDLIVLAIKRAMENADQVNQSEMQSIAGKMLPGLGGMFGK